MKRILVIAAFLLVPSTGAAQSPQADTIQKALESVDSGSVLRIRANRLTTRGTFTGMSSDALVLAVESGAQTPFRFASVEEIWKRGHYAKRGAIIGGSIGAAILTGFGLLLIKGLCEQPDGCANDYPTVALFGIGIGGGAGALAGGGIGYLTKRWIKIY